MSALESLYEVERSTINSYTKFRKNIFFLKSDIPLSTSDLRSQIQHKNSSIAIADIESILKFHKISYSSVTAMNIRSTLHILFMVTVNGRDTYIVKCNALSSLYKELHFFQEAWISKRVSSFLKVPEVLVIDITRKVVPFDYEVVHVVSGNVLDRNNSDQNILWRELGHKIALLHKIPTSGFGSFSISRLQDNEGVGIFESWSEYLLLQLDTHLNLCVDVNAITNDQQANKIRIVMGKSKELFSTAPSVLIHNDLAYYNILEKDGTIASLIDWEDAIAADPIFDIANFAAFHYLSEDQGRIGSFLEGYHDGTKKDYEKELKFWIYYLRIAICRTALQARYGFHNIEGAKKAFTRISHSLTKVEQLL